MMDNVGICGQAFPRERRPQQTTLPAMVRSATGQQPVAENASEGHLLLPCVSHGLVEALPEMALVGEHLEGRSSSGHEYDTASTDIQLYERAMSDGERPQVTGGIVDELKKLCQRPVTARWYVWNRQQRTLGQ
ncbi:hypothetical protein MILUP08_42680 [Micromonospora lupini str. Lupac 08]|uniref:Uncharacterized protein n=1 Tax=Micromonospora lupini str. Lupac 08 TaxID=1150864 RepID=I0L1Q2_9ACTN|nr:hypothetical protein MILUP08_42680 [Micromonospora lupini str. Lupac 08]